MPRRPAAAFAPRIDVHLSADDLHATLCREVRAGLTSTPRSLPPKWFYDDRGSALFDRITRLPEYYPTEREREILRREAATIAQRSQADTLIELGSGTSDKTRLLLDALRATGHLERFVPFDVSEGVLRWSAAAIAEAYPGIAVHGVVGDFDRHLRHLPGGTAAAEGEPPSPSTRLIAFLGGTIGNLDPGERARFLADLASSCEPGDALLLGTDLVKDEARLVAAYDDSAGVTAEFNRNVLHVLNRELGADFVPERYAHVARWDGERSWIEMRLRSVGDQRVRIGELDLELSFADGEDIRTEISAKFHRTTVERELAVAGFTLADWWTDAAGDFAVSLSFA